MVQKLWKLERGELSLEDAETKGSLQDESAKQEGLTLLQLCESEGKASIAFDKTFVKGYFRTGQALALQGKLKEALQVAKDGIHFACGVQDKNINAIDEFCAGVLSRIHDASLGNNSEETKGRDEADHEASIMAKILGRKMFGQKLQQEQRQIARRRKQEDKENKEKASIQAGTATTAAAEAEEKKGEEGDASDGKELGIESETQALVLSQKKDSKKTKTYLDDDGSSSEDDDEGAKVKQDHGSGFQEVDGSDSDDDDANKRRPARSFKKLLQAPAKPCITSEEVSFVSSKEKAAMASVLTMGKAAKGSLHNQKGKRTKKKQAGKAKARNKGLEDIIKMANAGGSFL